ncbi:SET domain-containing protein [Hortaea werneckii]|nr:SET domain-containing protein [Hortaea werneckii]KAI7109020.1 SET domain-containing protein [Hortaea werneckii]KAI7237559.1 SET domain-containing protein [Hortaea werneckii]KAI7340558.1 SET domain-containing protein [Hortaea werneckii]KAI7394495.1 SET domain-containing protein [Hortaea werneckii]
MIRAGKAAGWLQLPSEAVLPWAMLNEVDFKQVVPGQAVGKGGALLAKHSSPGVSKDGELMSVPHDLILSLERVLDHAKADKDFRAVLEALGEFGRCNLMGHSTPRGAILAFLLVQASVSCPDLAERVGVHCPFTDYVKSLPLENLPTFWSQDELALLVGTTLAPAVSSKLRSLHREYDHLCESTSQTRWYSLVGEHLNFDDWLQVDAMYRSRALDFPEIGHCMVPCIDLANHSAGESTIAVYEKDEHGNATLLLRDDKTVSEGEEVTITYGDEKGACEMLFSYGFLEAERKSAETLFLSLSIPNEDPYKSAKLQTADCAPGFKLIDAGDGEIDWKGEFIWLLCVGADDGLRFELARTVDGEGEEMQSFFGDEELTGGTAQLYSLLGKSELWDVYRLRAVALLQQRVFEQMQVLYGTQEEAEAVEHGGDTDVRTPVFENVMRLRKLEFDLMERAYEDFERQKLELAESEVVKRYLAKMNEDPATEEKEGEDFS